MATVNNCHYHRPAMLLTFWTNLNLVVDSMDAALQDPMVMEYDPLIQSRDIQVISGLLRRLRTLEIEAQNFIRKERIYLIIIQVFFMLIFRNLFGTITANGDSVDG